MINSHWPVGRSKGQCSAYLGAYLLEISLETPFNWKKLLFSNGVVATHT